MRDDGIKGRLVDALHDEAMALAEAARAYGDTCGRAERDALPPLVRIAFTCEMMKVTTRLTYVIAWALLRRAPAPGGAGPAATRAPSRRLDSVGRGDPSVVASLPGAARALIARSEAIHLRASRLEAGLATPPAAPGPARRLIARLETAF